MARRLKTHEGNGNGGTATAESSPLPGCEGLKTERLLLRLGAIDDSPFNARKNYDPKKLEDLAAAYRRCPGSIPCPLARPRGRTEATGERYELIYGHRRVRAARLAGLMELEIEVAQVDDAIARAIQWGENAGREGLHPLEEADAFRDWLEKEPGATVESIAAYVGKTPSLVRSRVKLSRLIPTARIEVGAGELGLGQAQLIAGLETADEQAEALAFALKEDYRGKPTVAQVAEWLEKRLQDLSSAPWPLDDPSRPGGACTECPKRTGASVELFAGADVGDRCLDRACFKAKVKDHEARGGEVLKVASGEKARAGVLPASAYIEIREPTPAEVQEIRERLEDEANADEESGAKKVEITDQDVKDAIAESWRFVPACEFTKPAQGPKGGMIKVCAEDSCSVHGKQIRAEKKRAAEAAKQKAAHAEEKPAETWEERAERERRKRELELAIEARIRQEVMKKIPMPGKRLRRRELALAAYLLVRDTGWEFRQQEPWKGKNDEQIRESILAYPDMGLHKLILELVLQEDEHLAAYAKELKVNVKAIEAEVKLAQEAGTKPAEKKTPAKKKAKGKR